MSIKALTDVEREVVHRAIRATFHFFDEDFQTRIGISPDAMNSLLRQWPNIDDSSDTTYASIAINNSLNDLLHGVCINELDALEMVGVNRVEMQRIYAKWSMDREWNSTGMR
jgi:hypothetical protein